MFNECSIKAAEAKKQCLPLPSHYCQHQSEGTFELIMNVSFFDKFVLRLTVDNLSNDSRLHLSEKKQILSSSLQQKKNWKQKPSSISETSLKSALINWFYMHVSVTARLASFWPTFSFCLFLIIKKRSIKHNRSEHSAAYWPHLMSPAVTYKQTGFCPTVLTYSLHQTQLVLVTHWHYRHHPQLPFHTLN